MSPARTSGRGRRSTNTRTTSTSRTRPRLPTSSPVPAATRATATTIRCCAASTLARPSLSDDPPVHISEKAMTRRYIPLYLLLAGALAGCDSLEQNPVATSSKDAVFGSENGLSLYATSFYNWMPDANNIIQSESMADYAARRDVPQFIRPGVYNPRVTDLTASGQYEVVALGGNVNWGWTALRSINYFLANNTNPDVPQ